MSEQRSVRLRIIWRGPIPTQHFGKRTEFGMQKGRDELLPGLPQPGGATAFETAVTPYRDKQGRLRFRGESIQGPPEEPFLYLSHRIQGEPGWVGRGKALLQPLDEAFLANVPPNATLETTMTRLGHRDAGSMTEWRVSESG